MFAFLGGCLGLLVRWGFEAMFAGDYSFLQPIAALLRFVIFIVVTVLVVVGAKMGSGGRGGTVLQFCAAVFTYLALSLAFVPLILNRMPGVPHTPGLVWAVVQSALEGPFTSVTRNLMNVTGLIAIFFCVALAWAGAAESKLVDGPFDAPGAERTMFKSMG
ncbi:MAG TPA: hypothetical protein VFC39_16200 [Acidobacteriaceae bacterium]|nr:hypothetical protein [Acidobacteriaceae bacterium]